MRALIVRLRTMAFPRPMAGSNLRFARRPCSTADPLNRREDRMQVTLRPANDSDLPFLLDLRFQTMDQHYIASGVHLSQDEHMQRVLHRFDCAEIIIVDGRAGGLVKLDRNGTDWHLIQIQLVPELQRRGLGAQLMDKIISEAGSAGASIRLGVLKVNPARRLYERLGFLVVGETSDSFKMQLPSK